MRPKDADGMETVQTQLRLLIVRFYTVISICILTDQTFIIIIIMPLFGLQVLIILDTSLHLLNVKITTL